MKKLMLITTLFLGIIIALTPLTNAASGAIEKDCDGVRFFGVVAEEESVRLEVRLHDGSFWTDPLLQDDYIIINSSGDFDVTVPWVTNPDGKLNRTALSVSTDGGSTWSVLVVNEDFLDCPPPPSGEGCTPGYWKNHLEDWPATGYSPADDFDTTFGVDLFDPDITLEQAVNAKGGKVNRLARHGTAALLSAAHPSVIYPLTVAEVIAAVQAGDADTLEEFNELGCPL